MSWSRFLRGLNMSLSRGKLGAWAAGTESYPLWDLRASVRAPVESVGLNQYVPCTFLAVLWVQEQEMVGGRCTDVYCDYYSHAPHNDVEDRTLSGDRIRLYCSVMS